MELQIFKAYFPLWPLRRDVFYWLDLFESLTDRMTGRSFTVPSYRSGSSSWKISKVPIDDDVVSVMAGETVFGRFSASEAIEISFQFEIPSIDILKNEISPSPDSDEMCVNLWRHFTEDSVCDEIALIMLAMDLSSPGSSHRGGYALSHNGNIERKKLWDGDIDDACEFARGQELFPGEDLEFSKVWNFLGKINGLRGGISTTPLGKAINSLTYLYTDQTLSARFFKIIWACCGLEGFFAEGSSARGRQTSEKLSLFLCLDETVVSRLHKLLYETRSKFIHGNKAISSSLVEVSPPEGKYTIDEWDAERAGTFFLLETVRQCIRKEIQCQEFDLILR